MAKYRFKTKKEFQKDGVWNSITNTPDHWNQTGAMNSLLGAPVPSTHQSYCDDNQPFHTPDYWAVKKTDYVEISKPKKSFLKKLLNKLGF